jgi:hypothetical protein
MTKILGCITVLLSAAGAVAMIAAPNPFFDPRPLLRLRPRGSVDTMWQPTNDGNSNDNK